MTTIALISAGNMGATIGSILVQGGATVLTSLDGRSQASAERARRNGIRSVDNESELADADLFLSIVPPGVAHATAERFIQIFGKATNAPYYIDCNALSPKTSRAIGAVFEKRDLPFADGAIIGRTDANAPIPPRLYLCGDNDGVAEILRAHGLDCRFLPGEIGSASELKMRYSALTKGFQALAILVTFATDEPDKRGQLLEELKLSQPEMLEWLKTRLPQVNQKAYRWEAEMKEISRFLADSGLDNRMFESAQSLFRDLAQNLDQANVLQRFLDETAG